MLPIDKHNWKSTVTQVGMSLLANLGMINSGMVVGFPSAIIPPLLGSGSGLHVSVEEAAWVAGLTFISAPIACLLAGPLIDRFGRQRCLLLLNIPFATGWILLATSPCNLSSLYMGRLLTGFGLGLASCAAITYTTEISSTEIRTAVVTLPPFMMAVGTFLVYLWAMIYQDSWVEASYFAFALSLLSLTLTNLLPESPLWLLNNGRNDDASKVLQRIRGHLFTGNVLNEFDGFVNEVTDKQPSITWQDTMKMFCQPQAYKPFIIMNAFFLFQQLAGVGIVIQFAVDFTRAAGIEAEAYYLSLCIAIIRMISAVMTSLACSKYGRRRPTLLSGIVMSTSLIALALCRNYFSLPWLSETLILLYVLSSSVGFSTLPWSMLGEVFPTNGRGFLSGVTVLMVYLESLIGARLYPCMVRSVGSSKVFLFFGVSGLVGTSYLYSFLPETHGKSLIQIEEYFKDGDISF